MAVHQQLVSGRWATFSLVEQLANIGSEVDRAIRAATAGRIERRDRAVERALELFDLAAADDRWRGPRRREILRAREEFCRIIFETGTDTAPDSLESFSRYFLYFAMAARMHAGRA